LYRRVNPAVVFVARCVAAVNLIVAAVVVLVLAALAPFTAPFLATGAFVRTLAHKLRAEEEEDEGINGAPLDAEAKAAEIVSAHVEWSYAVIAGCGVDDDDAIFPDAIEKLKHDLVEAVVVCVYPITHDFKFIADRWKCAHRAWRGIVVTCPLYWLGCFFWQLITFAIAYAQALWTQSIALSEIELEPCPDPVFHAAALQSAFASRVFIGGVVSAAIAPAFFAYWLLVLLFAATGKIFSPRCRRGARFREAP
jgi:hypothetical protein